MSAPVRQTDYIGDLCVALAHRWEPERLFVIFTAYFDETGTHEREPTVIIAGFVGHAYQWRRFETKLVRLQERHGFKVFHSKDFIAHNPESPTGIGKGEFLGWTDDQRQNLITDLAELVRDNLTHGITIQLEYERYMSEYRAEPFPRKLHKDSQYGACFRGCLGYLLEMLQQRGNRDKLNIVFERGHKNVWDCERIFNDLRGRFRRMGHDILGSFTVDTKEGAMPLMVADMLAMTHALARQPDAAYPLAEAETAPSHTKGSLVFIELAPDALRELKTNFERLRELEIEVWREARAARKALRERPA